MTIQRIDICEIGEIAPLTARFRVELDALKNISSAENLQSARDELAEYLRKGYPVFTCRKDGEALGYCVCRTEDDAVIWLESLYVKQDARRTGAASLLFRAAEDVARSYGQDTLY
ncbi:MAG: GNAT family N-acetyltransferase, partial [Oscillospiraceae bacterium]|nr:GNAT family N-acetyltransferase [Oscillospiraceae bacterium]